MNIIIEAPTDETIQGNALKTLLGSYLKTFPIFEDTKIVVRAPYSVEKNPNWEEIEENLFVRKEGEE